MRRSVQHLPRYAIVTAAFALAAFTAGCGDKKPAKQPPAKPTAPPAKPKVEKPKPVDLGLDVAKFSKAHLIEKCALKFGESPEDALTVAIQNLAGLPYTAPPPPPTPAEEKAAKDAVDAAAKAKKTGESAKKTGKSAKKTEKSAKMRGKLAKESALAAPAKPPSAADAANNGPTTPGGRQVLEPDAKALVAKYQKAVSLLPKRPDVAEPLAKQIEACKWAPQLGLVEQELVDRYAEAFVTISCLQIQMRDKSGNVDALKHAQAATEVFKKHKFTARSFSQIGLAMSLFSDVTARVHTERRERCEDPVEVAAMRDEEGSFVGTLAGKIKAVLSFSAKAGATNGTVTFTGGALESGSWQLTGAMSGKRVHMFARSGDDWIRMEGVPAKGDGKSKGKWKAEVGYKKLSGEWSWQRFAPKKPAPAAATNAPAVPGKAP